MKLDEYLTDKEQDGRKAQVLVSQVGETSTRESVANTASFVIRDSACVLKYIFTYSYMHEKSAG